MNLPLASETMVALSSCASAEIMGSVVLKDYTAFFRRNLWTLDFLMINDFFNLVIIFCLRSLAARSFVMAGNFVDFVFVGYHSN